MESNFEAVARKAFRKAVRTRLFSFLKQRGFSEIENQDKCVSSDWHRQRADGGYDLISIIFPKRGGAAFSVLLQVAPKEGVVTMFNEHVPAEKVIAYTTNQRFHLFPIRAGILTRMVRALVKYSPFRMRAPRNDRELSANIDAVLNQFFSDFEQAEKWWSTNVLGASMKEANIGAQAKRK